MVNYDERWWLWKMMAGDDDRYMMTEMIIDYNISMITHDYIWWLMMTVDNSIDWFLNLTKVIPQDALSKKIERVQNVKEKIIQFPPFFTYSRCSQSLSIRCSFWTVFELGIFWNVPADILTLSLECIKLQLQLQHGPSLNSWMWWMQKSAWLKEDDTNFSWFQGTINSLDQVWCINKIYE